MLNRKEIIRMISKKTKISERKATEVVDFFLQTIIDSVKGGEKVVLHGFGTFKPVKLKQRKARNPQTGEMLDVPSYRTIKFKASFGIKVL